MHFNCFMVLIKRFFFFFTDLSKPVAVVMFSLLKRIEYLEKQVNETLAETKRLQHLQRTKNCSVSEGAKYSVSNNQKQYILETGHMKPKNISNEKT